MTEYKMVWLLLKDFPHLREFLYKNSINKFPTREIRGDIKKLRESMVINESVSKD